MCRFPHPLIPLVLIIGLVAAPASAADKPDETAPKVVTFKQLVAALKEHKGKLVVVDFWADY